MTPEQFCTVRDLFEQAMQLPAESRNAYLHSACRDNIELLTELERMIEAAGESNAPIDRPALEVVAADRTATTAVPELIPATDGIIGAYHLPEPLGFAPGTILTRRYRIVNLLGRGGMGEVYRADDLLLGQPVALKFLPYRTNEDPILLSRFRSEIRMARQVTHPNICRVYDIGEGDGLTFLTMEYIDGEDFRSLLRRIGRLPEDKALDVARNLCLALAALHEKAVIHRDLKPANIMLDGKGQIRITDFGLAGIAEHIRDVRSGTPAYMAPEQLAGREVTIKSDIYSLGLVLHELFTGRTPSGGRADLEFEQKSVANVIYRCLERDPQMRPASALSVAEEIPQHLDKPAQCRFRKESLQSTENTSNPELAPLEQSCETDRGKLGPLTKERRRKLSLTALLVLVIVLVGAVLWFFPRAVTSTALEAMPLTTYPGNESEPSFSPDGNQVAFTWDGEQQDNPDIYVKLIGSAKPLRLTTDPAPDISPAWSPDGRSIAFLRHDFTGKWILLLVPALGGPEREVAEFTTGFAGFGGWSPDARLLLVALGDPSRRQSALYLVSVESGETRQITMLPGGIAGDFNYNPAISPDGRQLAFVRSSTSTSNPDLPIGDIYAVPLVGGLPTQKLPRRITFDRVSIGGIAWTSDSRELVFSSRRGGSQALWRVGVYGSETPARLPVGDNALSPAISHQGNRLVYSETIPTDTNIWRLNLWKPGEQPAPFIASTREDDSPEYSPDGKLIAFQSERSGKHEVWVCEDNGSDAVQLVDMDYSGSPRWSPEGRRIAFDALVDGRWQIFTVSSRGGKPQRVTRNISNDIRPGWSRDGKWIYFGSSRNQQLQIWKVPTAGGDPVQVTRNGGDDQVESEDGKRIYYTRSNDDTRNFDNSLWKIGADGGEETQVLGSLYSQSFAVAHDGLYYVGPSGLQFLSFAGGRPRLIVKLHKRPSKRMSVSPDGHWLLYTQIDRQGGSDLMVVENFR